MNKLGNKNSISNKNMSEAVCNTITMSSYYFYAVRFFKYCFFYYFTSKNKSQERRTVTA